MHMQYESKTPIDFSALPPQKHTVYVLNILNDTWFQNNT